MSSTTGVEGSRSPTLAEVIRAAMDCREVEHHTSLPCRVEKIDPAGKFVDVKPLIRRRFLNPDGTEINESLPVIPRVPIAWPRAGKFFITFPIKPGDLVEVVITEASRDAFQAGAGTSRDAPREGARGETDPDDFRRFDLSDAWAYPGGGHPDATALENYDPDDLVIGVDGGVVAHFKDNGEIHLGSKNADQFIALSVKTRDEITAQRDNSNTNVSTFNSHTQTVPAAGLLDGLGLPVTGAATAAPPSSGQAAPPSVASVASVKVVAD